MRRTLSHLPQPNALANKRKLIKNFVHFSFSPNISLIQSFSISRATLNVLPIIAKHKESLKMHPLECEREKVIAKCESKPLGKIFKNCNYKSKSVYTWGSGWNSSKMPQPETVTSTLKYAQNYTRHINFPQDTNNLIRESVDSANVPCHFWYLRLLTGYLWARFELTYHHRMVF